MPISQMLSTSLFTCPVLGPTFASGLWDLSWTTAWIAILSVEFLQVEDQLHSFIRLSFLLVALKSPFLKLQQMLMGQALC